MKVTSLACNNCGAPLEVAETTKFATCTHCGSRLSITHTGSAAYTEVLAQIGQHTEQMSDDLAAIRLHNELERLDREAQDARVKWQSHLSHISTTVAEARRFDKGSSRAKLGLLISAVLLLGTLSSNGAWIIPFGIGIWAFLALRNSQSHARKHNDWKQYYQKQQQLFSDAEQGYNAKRTDIIRRLEQV